MKILIAEDEITIAKALKVMLEKNKYSVDMVHNGVDALDYMRIASPVSMPGPTIILQSPLPPPSSLPVSAPLRGAAMFIPHLSCRSATPASTAEAIY